MMQHLTHPCQLWNWNSYFSFEFYTTINIHKLINKYILLVTKAWLIMQFPSPKLYNRFLLIKFAYTVLPDWLPFVLSSTLSKYNDNRSLIYFPMPKIDNRLILVVKLTSIVLSCFLPVILSSPLCCIHINNRL